MQLIVRCHIDVPLYKKPRCLPAAYSMVYSISPFVSLSARLSRKITLGPGCQPRTKLPSDRGVITLGPGCHPRTRGVRGVKGCQDRRVRRVRRVISRVKRYSHSHWSPKWLAPFPAAFGCWRMRRSPIFPRRRRPAHMLLQVDRSGGCSG